LLLALIGEQFGEDSVNICGAVCNARAKGDKVIPFLFVQIMFNHNRFVFGQRMQRMRMSINGLGEHNTYIKEMANLNNGFFSGIMKDRFLQRLKGGQIRINYEGFTNN
jgi:hypothetical protein